MGNLLFQFHGIFIYLALMLMMYIAGEREYFIPHGNLTWDDARNHCRICFKELVTVTPENTQLITQRLNSDHWIGLRKNFNSTNNSSLSWSYWVNGDPLSFQNWYPGWPVFKSPPPKIDCCSCSCTCPAKPPTGMTTSIPVTENVTDINYLLDQNVTNLTGYWDSITSNTTSYSDLRFTTSASPLKMEAECERSPMPVAPETSENDSYIEDSCVAMLSFGPWVEKRCLELLPYVCYEDRFFGHVNVTNVTLTAATLAWMPAPGDITHYRVEIKGDEKREYDRNTLNYDLSNLNPGGRYEIQVFPVKCGRDLNPQNATFYTYPNKVTDLRVTNATETSVIVEWNKPKGNLGFYLFKTQSENITVKTDLDKNQTIQVDGLTPGSLYTFAVQTGVQDLSRWSEESYIRTNTKPGKVSRLSVSNITNDSVQLNWTPPEGSFTGFRVEAVGINFEFYLNKEVTKNSMLVEELVAGSQIRLSVTTLANYSTSYNYISLALEGDEETIDAYTTPGPISSLTVSTDDSSLSAHWSGPEGNYSSFYVELKLNEEISQSNSTNETTIKFDELKRAANYTVVVFAVNEDIRGPPVACSVFTKPSPPTDVKATNITSNSITFEWMDHVNVAPGNYNVQLNSSIWHYNKNDTSKPRKYTFRNLKSGTKYDFSVSAQVGTLESLPESCSVKTDPDKVEISLAMLCTSARPLYCDNATSRENVIKKLEEYFNTTLGDNIFWESPAQEYQST